jgi:hypothetical protein
MRNDGLRATAISVGSVCSDALRVNIASWRVDIDALSVDVATVAELPRRRDNGRFRAALVLLSHAGHSQKWRDECDGKDVFDIHDSLRLLPHENTMPSTGLVALIFVKEA